MPAADTAAGGTQGYNSALHAPQRATLSPLRLRLTAAARFVLVAVLAWSQCWLPMVHEHAGGHSHVGWHTDDVGAADHEHDGAVAPDAHDDDYGPRAAGYRYVDAAPLQGLSLFSFVAHAQALLPCTYLGVVLAGRRTAPPEAPVDSPPRAHYLPLPPGSRGPPLNA